MAGDQMKSQASAVNRAAGYLRVAFSQEKGEQDMG
jgi:hypothetical protein